MLRVHVELSIMGRHSPIVEDDHVPVFERGKNKLYVALAIVVSLGHGERVKHASIDIRRCPARSDNVFVGGNANFELAEQRRFGPVGVDIAPVGIP